MKTIALLFVVVAALGMVAANEEASAACHSDNQVDFESALFCIGNGREFNGRKTCQAGCFLACQQPGCSGFHSCTQIPNASDATTYLHKYRCKCNSS